MNDVDTSRWGRAKRARASESDRRNFVRLMNDPQTSEVTQKELDFLFGTGAPEPSPAPGIVLVDLEAIRATRFIERAVEFPMWPLSFAAFIIENFWVEPIEADAALVRASSLKLKAAERVGVRHEWLVTQFDSRLRNNAAAGAYPIDILLALQDQGADGAPLLAVLYRLFLKAQDTLRATKAEAAQAEERFAREHSHIGIDGTLGMRAALFLLAREQGVIGPPGIQPAAEAVERALTTQMERLNADRLARQLHPLPYEIPSIQTLKAWVKSGADALEQNMRGQRGRKKKTN